MEEPMDIMILMPMTWACIGPVAAPEVGADPITAFAKIKPLLQTGERKLAKTLEKSRAMYRYLREQGLLNYTQIMKSVAFSKNLQPPKEVQDQLPSFPTEYGPGGRTIWAVAHSDHKGGKIVVNFTEAAAMAGVYDHGNTEELPQAGWAATTIKLERLTTVLVRCNEAFMVDDDIILKTPDAYEERRAVSVYQLQPGEHHVYVRFRQNPFWCDIVEDDAEGRRTVTQIKRQSEIGEPLAVLSDSMMADIVEGRLASPYVAVPVINMDKSPVRVGKVEIMTGPPGLSLERLPGKEDVDIMPGQSYIMGFIFNQSSEPLECEHDEKNHSVLSLTLLLHPQQGDNWRQPINVTVSTACISPRAGGYRVTFPDYDGSVQEMWVAPPNVSSLVEERCPEEGCPVLLSLHGAAVTISPNWGHNYALDKEHGSPFPYPAWLIEPSNRFHWGTDWEGPGFDNGISAMEYVRMNLPGLKAEEQPHLRLDAERLFITGHSMGGHGCLVYSVHDPDRLLASLCGACWSSQARYVGAGGSALIDEVSGGLLKGRMSEHAADLLARNFRGVPLKIVYGDKDDNVPPREPRYMARLVDSYSGFAGIVNISELNDTGHWFTQNIPEVADFLHMHLNPADGPVAEWPLPPLPEEFEFTVASISSFGTKGNIKALQLADAARPGRFFVRRCRYVALDVTAGECGGLPVEFIERRERPEENVEEALDDGADEIWYIEAFNVRRFTFKNPPVRGRLLPRLLVLDGQPFNVSASLAGGGHFCLARPGAQGAAPLWKVCWDSHWETVQRAGTQMAEGPFHNVLRRAKLCIAHGTGPGQAELALVIANKLYFVSRYAVPIMYARQENMTGKVPGYCNDANIIFIGQPQDNTLTDANRCTFPYVTFHDKPSNGFTLSGLAYTGPGIGLIAMGRLQNGRLGLILAGTDSDGLALAGDRLPITSFKDGADYMVLGRDASWQGLGGVLAAGYLDPLWRPSGSGWAEPEHSVARWNGIGVDGSPEDPRCDEVRTSLLQSDKELNSYGHLTCGMPAWMTVLLACSLHAGGMYRPFAL